MEAPFYCDYGFNIQVGENFYSNFNLTILDVNQVIIGDNVMFVPGVTIGNDVVVGAGSVVTRDLPDRVIAAENPCRVIREITEADRKYYFRDREFDVEDY